jgi:hypothetical protein
MLASNLFMDFRDVIPYRRVLEQHLTYLTYLIKGFFCLSFCDTLIASKYISSSLHPPFLPETIIHTMLPIHRKINQLQSFQGAGKQGPFAHPILAGVCRPRMLQSSYLRLSTTEISPSWDASGKRDRRSSSPVMWELLDESRRQEKPASRLKRRLVRRG